TSANPSDKLLSVSAAGKERAAPVPGEDGRDPGWKTKYSIGDIQKEQRGRRCPLCRGIIPPSRDQISSMKMTQLLMKNKDKSDPKYEDYARQVKQFEDEYGEDWESTAIEYGNDCVSLPLYVVKSTRDGNFRTALQWLGKGNIKDRVNAKCESVGNAGLMFLAAEAKDYDFMSFLLLNGADVNIMNSIGSSVLSWICKSSICRRRGHPKTIRILLSWGAELIREGKQITSQERKQLVDQNIMDIMEGDTANLLLSELGGRRCKIVSAPDSRDDLVGKTCVVGRHIKNSGGYEVMVEFTNESLLLGADNLERCDRTPHDPGYFVECKNNRLIRRDFESNEECRAFIASLGAEEGEFAEVDPEAEAKAEQAAADLLVELGLDDLEDQGSNAPKKGARSAPPAGKKKKRGGKKKRPSVRPLAPPRWRSSPLSEEGGSIVFAGSSQPICRGFNMTSVSSNSRPGGTEDPVLCLTEDDKGPMDIAEISASLEQQDRAEKEEARQNNSQSSLVAVSHSCRESSISSVQPSLVGTDLTVSAQELTTRPADGSGIQGHAQLDEL
ncbi:hypothetical protein THAOC_35468, partial [Thalassiosira oceanica]